MLLVDHQIRQHMEWGSIVIDPFNADQLNNASYDLTVGPFFARYAHEAAPVDLGSRKPRFQIEDARKAGYVYLRSFERILGYSNEFAGGRQAYAPPHMRDVAVNTHLQATSTAARLGLTACMCAGWGDVGFVNRWTFEIQNLTPHGIQLPVGAILAQLVFYEVKPTENSYHREVYQPTDEVERLKKLWSPEMMLPKSLKVRDHWKGLYPI